MGKVYPAIAPELREWIARQKIFFVASAPLAADGRVNCSPKGGDSFRVLDERTVAYADFTGSGVETIAHVQENGRLLVMFCAFEGPPKIVRLHGRGEILYPDHAEFAALLARFTPNPGIRALVRLHVERVSDSCGFSVPLMDYREDRPILDEWARKKGDAGLDAYRREKNRRSLDGLPGYRCTDEASLPLFADAGPAAAVAAVAVSVESSKDADTSPTTATADAIAAPTISLREMTLADYDAVHRLWLDTEGMCLGDDDRRERVALYLRRNTGLCFVATRGDEIVGAVLNGHDGRRAILRHLAVRRDHRGRGLGRRLVRTSLDALTAASIDRCNVFVLDANPAGLGFWRRLGFVALADDYRTLQLPTSAPFPAVAG